MSQLDADYYDAETTLMDRALPVSVTDPLDGSIEAQLRARIHRLADTVQNHHVELVSHQLEIGVLTERVKMMGEQMSTRDQLSSAVNDFTFRLTSTSNEMALKLQLVHADLDPIKKGIYGLLALVLTGVVLAIMGLVLKGH